MKDLKDVVYGVFNAKPGVYRDATLSFLSSTYGENTCQTTEWNPRNVATHLRTILQDYRTLASLGQAPSALSSLVYIARVLQDALDLNCPLDLDTAGINFKIYMDELRHVVEDYYGKL